MVNVVVTQGDFRAVLESARYYFQSKHGSDLDRDSFYFTYTLILFILDPNFTGLNRLPSVTFSANMKTTVQRQLKD